MITINILTNEYLHKGYTYLNEPDNIARDFNSCLEYRLGEAAPFTDKDSEMLFEHLSSTEPYKSRGFKRTDVFTVADNGVIYSLTNITNDIKVALLILKNRNSAIYGNMFIPPWFLSTAQFIWLANNYDLTLYMKLSDIFVFSRCQTQANVEFRYNGQTIENIDRWLYDNMKFTRKYAEPIYRSLTHGLLYIAADKPLLFKDFRTLLNDQTRPYLKPHSIDKYCDEYSVHLPAGVLCIEEEAWKYPLIYGIIEKDGNGLFVEIDTEKYATTAKILDVLVTLYKEDNADRMTFIISNEYVQGFIEDYAENTEYGVIIDRNSKTITIAERVSAAIRFYQAMERADIPHDLPPERLHRY